MINPTLQAALDVANREAAPMPTIQNWRAMRQAIVTKYLGPSNVRGARVKATAEAGSVTINWDHALNIDSNHAAAALALAEKFGWHGAMVGGGLPGSGYAFVFVE